MPSISDADIFASFKADRESGCRLLLDRFKERLYLHIRRIVVSHEDAEDALQETFIRLFRSIGRLDEERHTLTAWAYRIATNEAMRVRSSRTVHRLLDDAADVAADSYVDYSDVAAVKLQRAIHSLPHKQRVTFSLRYYDGLDYADIAHITDSTPESAKVSYAKAKQKIIKILDI
ncbi:MAG: sigma-70 family RNA polymerase sigma factor [Muribaculaceae bacterium]|nr:sigma-70 family RNA polymerase sigma factor [Muribaculaceae bacterium]